MIAMELPLEDRREEEDENNDDEKTECTKGKRGQKETTQTIETREDNVLNLNNEVVKMRKEVKRVRTLIIRKLTRQITALKKKKGKNTEIERNQRRAARLLEEIHAIKDLVPDLVTKTALQKKLNFEKVCKNPKSSISDRAIARIATHPQFNKKIEDIKAAVKAFKEERSKEGMCVGKLWKKDELKEPQHTSSDKVVKKKDINVGPIISQDNDIAEALQNKSSFSTPKETVDESVQKKETPQTENKSKKQIPVKNSEVKDIVKTKEQNKSEEKISTFKLSAEVLPKSDFEAESDLESSDNDEKEYFDDSTEERYNKHSSGESEESDNDFFLGKVSKFKKKRKNINVEKDMVKEIPVDGNSNNLLKTDKVQSELDELESRLKSKATSMKSVFCPSLSGPKQGKGAVKGDSKFGDKDFSKQSKFPKQFTGKPKDSGSKYIKPCPGHMPLEEEKGFMSVGRERGQGKERTIKHKDARVRTRFPHKAPQQPLHPSWEASKKRKAQQGHLLAFQGQKIKFDDD